jgi:hypothetical protein
MVTPMLSLRMFRGEVRRCGLSCALLGAGSLAPPAPISLQQPLFFREGTLMLVARV